MITTSRKRIASRLKKKGWDNHYIAKTSAIMKKAEKKKHPVQKTMDMVTYWVILFATLLGNIILLAGVLPLVIGMPQLVVILVLSMIGLCFGFLIDNVIREINLNSGHYILAGFLIPVIATINMYFLLRIAGIIAGMINISLVLNPLLLVSCYVLFFSAPHLAYKLKENA
jgi:hypothetical protein